MLGNKGQEAAPFELLVAVIIMGFVIFVGLRAMAIVDEQRCYNEINATLENMKTKLETVVTERSSQSINFRMSSCYNPRDEVIRIKDFSQPPLCAEYCGAAKRLCTILDYYNRGEGFSIRKCLNISPDTVFPYNPGTCPERDGEKLVDYRNEMVQGNYLLVNKTSVTATYPTICAYRKSDSSTASSSSSGWDLSCINNIASKLNALKNDVENGKTNLDLSLNTGCSDLDSGIIRLITNCSSQCASGKCLQYTYYGTKNYSKTVCVNS